MYSVKQAIAETMKFNRFGERLQEKNTLNSTRALDNIAFHLLWGEGPKAWLSQQTA